MATTMTISGAVLFLAGSGRSADLEDLDIAIIGGEYIIDTWINEAESTINSKTRVNYTSTFSGLTEAKRELLSSICSSLAAIKCIQYDMGGYTSRTEAEDKINTLRDIANRGLQMLNDKEVQRFINDP